MSLLNTSDLKLGVVQLIRQFELLLPETSCGNTDQLAKKPCSFQPLSHSHSQTPTPTPHHLDNEIWHQFHIVKAKLELVKSLPLSD